MKISVCLIRLILLAVACSAAQAGTLEEGWSNPPVSARARAYWWWLNGNVTKESITRDLEQMKAKGFGGAVIIDAGGATQEKNDPVPHGPTFFSPEWRELYKHALREASRLGLEMSLTIQSGWNLGGPMVTAEDAAKKLVWSEARVFGPGETNLTLAPPASRDGFYRDAFTLAYPINTNRPASRRPLENWLVKTVNRTLTFSTPDTSPLFTEYPAAQGEEDTTHTRVIDVTTDVDDQGILDWRVPEGQWAIMRFGYTIGDSARVSTCSEGWDGYALDVLDAGAFQRYWDAVVEPLLADAGSLAGTTLKYLHTDSWEIEAINWTPSFREEFQKRRGYDLLGYMPVLAGKIIDNREASDRFLADFRRTIGDLAIDNHYRPFRDNAHRHGLEIHCESGGPHAVPIDAQQCLGMDDAPMSEFWAWSWRHRTNDAQRFFVKQPASAAHTYGRDLVFAEGFTSIGPHWQERIWNNLKPAFDRALCEGLNMLVWHAFVCSPAEMGIPGQQYFAGTHFNPNVTWWEQSGPFLDYIDRCQFLLQQGRFVADVCYYYGDHVPNFTQLKQSDPARVLPGFDYDVITEETLLNSLSVRDGNLVLPDGMSYRLLVLPSRRIMALPVAHKLKELAAAGASILGPAPMQASGLVGFPGSDLELGHLAGELWTPPPRGAGIIPIKTARQVLLSRGVPPDFDCTNRNIDYIHRRSADADIYFVANRTNVFQEVSCVFRVASRAPEIWDAVSGAHQFAASFSEKDGRTTLPLELAPCGSCFVIFREPAEKHPATAKRNSPAFETVGELPGPWTVQFDTKWGGPESAQFDELASWTTRPEAGIKYYSGAATYRKSFDLPGQAAPVWLDLGDVRELAQVRLNGQDLGIVWAPPFRVELTPAVKPGANELEIKVINFWPNRIIGDQFLPKDQRLTKTNIRKLDKKTPLMESGLLGPVRLQRRIPDQ